LLRDLDRDGEGALRVHRARAAAGPETGRNRWTSGLVDPGRAPGRKILGRPLVEERDEVRPGRIAEGVRLQVLAHAVAERVLAEQHLEVPHDDRRLLVDDRAVKAAGLVQVVERLSDGVGARG